MTKIYCDLCEKEIFGVAFTVLQISENAVEPKLLKEICYKCDTVIREFLNSMEVKTNEKS